MKALEQHPPSPSPYSFIKHCLLGASLTIATMPVAYSGSLNIYLGEMSGNPELNHTAWSCDKTGEQGNSWQLEDCRSQENDDSIILSNNQLTIRNGLFFTDDGAVVPRKEESLVLSIEGGALNLSCAISAEFLDAAKEITGIALKSCTDESVPAAPTPTPTANDESSTASASCAGVLDSAEGQKQPEPLPPGSLPPKPLKPCADLTIANESQYKQSEYPNCIGKGELDENNKWKDAYPTACRGATSIVGQHTYAQRFYFTGWGTEQGYCAGTENTRALIYATTNDAMKAASEDYADFGTLDMAISKSAGDLNPADSDCKWTGTSNINVSVPIAQAGAKVRGRACKLTPGTMYYINVKPSGNKTAQCGLSSPLSCQFSLYTNAVPTPQAQLCR